MQNEAPYKKTLVLVGGGHSHIEVLKQFGMAPLPGLRIILISRNIDTPYSGMLPGYLAGHYSYDDSHIDLSSLTQFANTTFIQAEVNALDTNQRRIHCVGRPPVQYDFLSINIGSRPSTLMVPGAIENTYTVKPIDRFIHKWELFIKKIQQANKSLNIGVVGAGAGGVELILSTQFRINNLHNSQTTKNIQHKFYLLTNSKEILPTHNKQVRKKFRKILTERGINIYTEHNVIEVKEDALCCENGVQLPIDVVIWVTHASAPQWIKDSGIKTDGDGFIHVNDFLQSTSHPNIFAAGDISASINYPRPKSGVFAVRQGPYLETNLRHTILEKPLKKYLPQKKFLSLISSGDKYAVASRGNFTIEGKWVWKLKNWIDKKFIRKYNELPDMLLEKTSSTSKQSTKLDQISNIEQHPMRCCGCGAKVNSNILGKVIRKLQPIQHKDILLGLHEPDDAAAIKLSSEKILVQSVDYFRALVDDEYLFGKITANHALGDIFAMGASVHSALAIATIPFASEKIMEEQLFQMLSGAIEVLNEAGCSLIGGHSGEGSELAFGLSINGISDSDKLLRKNTMNEGDILLLTKPIGTGTLFAANMRRKCKGYWIESAIDSMLLSNKKAADILICNEASACTDITGFGLLGHLLEMINSSSSISVTLDLDAIPILDGALETITNGIVSSLHESNLKSETTLNLFNKITHPNYPLIFDPQTAGGLLACIPKSHAENCIKELHENNYIRASIIGEINRRVNESDPTIKIRNY